MDGTSPQGILIYLAIAMIVAGASAVRKPIQKFNHGVKIVAMDTGKGASQPFRHPKKDAKFIGSHIKHFFKGDR